MRVLNVTTADTGGNGYRTKQAFTKHAPDWTYDLVTGSRKYMQYPEDKPWVEGPALWQQADVVHLRNSFHLQRKLRAPIRPAVIQHHGTMFRTHPETLLSEQRRHKALGLASTLDLWLIAPDELEWLPSPYDLDWLASFSQPREDDGVYRIAHAPTNRRVKGTEAFLSAVEQLRKDVEVELILIERASWADCLRRKSQADVYYDQVELGYGNNAIEAWGMGMPVVCGAQPDTLDEMTRRFGSLPFYEADPGTIYDALLALADPRTRKTWADRGLDHVSQWHDEARVVQQLQGIYQRACKASI